MSAWKQLVWSLVVTLFACFATLKLSPTAAGFLANHGLAGPMARLGLLPPAGPADTTAPGQGPKASGSASQTTSQTASPGGAGQGKSGFARKLTVVLKPAGTAVINDKIAALGTGAALQSVTVLPLSNGTLTEVLVTSGAKVTAGQVIARLDSKTQEIAHDKAKLAADDAQRTLERNKALVQSNAAPASQTQAVELAAQMADLSLRSTELDLSNRAIVAPIAGVAGIVRLSVGNAVTAQTPIVAIVDSSALIVNFWLPERLVGQVKVGDAASLVPVARPEATLSAKVTSIDNQIDPASGTYQMQAQVDNGEGSLQPGMAFSVALQFVGQTYVTVNPLSVQWGSAGAYVWRFADGKVDKVPVQIVQRNTESVLVAGAVKAGDQIVTEGLDGLKPGADVQVFGGDAAAAVSPAIDPVAQATPNVGSAQAAEAPVVDPATDATARKKHKHSGDAAPAGN